MIKDSEIPNVPKAVGPYSLCVEANGFLFASGQIGIDPETGKLKDSLESQTQQVLDNIAALLSFKKLTPDNVVKCTVFLTNSDDFSTVNEMYKSLFGESKPARSTVTVQSLPLGAKVEIEIIAQLRA